MDFAIPKTLDGYWTGLIKQRIAGKMTHQELIEVVKALHVTEYTKMLDRWMSGDLFKFQKASFDAWIEVDEPGYKEEAERAYEYISFEGGCSEPMNEDIRNFITRRIWRFGPGARKDIAENASKREMCRDFWRKENIKFKWDWR